MSTQPQRDDGLEIQYRQLVEQVPAITYIAERGIDGRWQYVSPQINQILGFTPEDWMSEPKSWRRQVHPDDLKRVLTEEQALCKDGEHYRTEYRLRTRAGNYLWVRDEATYVRHPATGEFFMRGLLLDITDYKQAGEELRRSEQRLQTTINAAPIVLFALDLEGRFTFSEGKGLQDLGLRPGQAVGQSVFNLYRDAPEILDHARRALSGEDFWAVDPVPGLQLVYETRWSAARDGAGNQVGVIGVATDVTEREHLQEKLRSLQQMEAIGRLAAGIAHDFNNLMHIVLGHVELLSDETDLTAPMQSGLAQVRQAAQRATSLTQQLLAFSRKQVLQPRVVNLNEIVADVTKMLSRVIGEDIELVSHLDSYLPPVKADPVQMQQVLMNLAANARDAMPNGGRLLVETAKVSQAEVWTQPGSSASPCVMLSVSDTGHGMSGETLGHVFEPFFTTKETGKGTGLGLATVYGIVTQSGGNISVSSTLGKGTTFRIYLPAETAAADIVAPGPVEKVSGGAETILIVEDEPNLREIARVFLEGFGYHVLEATDVEEALQLARTLADPIHLTLTDVVMPGMSGRQLAEQILRVRPEMKIIYMTGYTDDMVVHHKVLEPGVSLLQKPFDKLQLATKVRQVLDAR